MLKYVFLFVLSVLLACKSRQVPKPLSNTVQKHGWLSVKGSQIVDEHGKPPQLRGISLSWSIWGGKKYYNPEVVDWLVKDFKIDIIRVLWAIQPEGGYLQYPDEQKKLIFSVIDRAIANGIYVMMDWHDHNANLHVEEAKKFFNEVAEKYAKQPHLIYELWNEPERQSWQVVKDYAASVIPEVRAHSKNSLIIVGSPHWDQDIDTVASDPLEGFTNIAYSFHFYASEPSHQEKLMERANFALKKGLPIFITEWGVGEANGDGVFDQEKLPNG